MIKIQPKIFALKFNSRKNLAIFLNRIGKSNLLSFC